SGAWTAGSRSRRRPPWPDGGGKAKAGPTPGLPHPCPHSPTPAPVGAAAAATSAPSLAPAVPGRDGPWISVNRGPAGLPLPSRGTGQAGRGFRRSYKSGGRGLLGRFRRAHVALAVHPRAVEAARAAHAGGELVAGRVDALDAGLGLLARSDPGDPVAPRHRGDVGPRRLRRRVGGQRLAQVRGNLRFRFLLHRRDLERDSVARIDSGGLAQRLVDLQPVAALAVRLQRCLEALAFERAVD